MNVTQNDKGVYVNEDPVVGMILLTRATLEETRAHMNIIIKLGIEEDSVHIIYFEDVALGVVLIEPNSILTGKKNSNNRLDTQAAAMKVAITAQVETVHMIGSYMSIWEQEDTSCAYVEGETIGYDLIGGKTMPRTVRVFQNEGKKRNYLLETPLTRR